MKPLVHPLPVRCSPIPEDNPVRPENALFLVGKDSRGRWVARNQSGRCGGLFVGRAAALKFALSQNGNRPDAVIAVAGVLELDLAAKSGRRAPRRVNAGMQRRVA